MEGETQEEPAKDLNELQNADWVRRSTWCIKYHFKAGMSNSLYIMSHMQPTLILSGPDQ